MKWPVKLPHRRSRNRRHFLAGLLAIAPVAGCANWREQADSPSILQTPKLPSNTVVVELAFVRVTELLAPPVKEMWRQTDEQKLDVDLRRELYANGIRTGTLGTELPSVLRQALDEQTLTSDTVAKDPNVLSDPTVRQYRLQCRAGKVIPIAVTPGFRDRDILLRENGVVRGQTFPDSQCRFDLEAAPLPNGLAVLHLIPTVEFGDSKNRLVGTDGQWQVGARKEQRRFSDLSMSMELRPGETILVTATDPPHGVGGAFFAAEEDAAEGRRLLLIRLAQAHGDGVFSAAE